MAFVIAAIGQKGGTGKSSLVRLLAVELARKRHRVVVVDSDVAQRTVAAWNEARQLNKLKPELEVVVVDREAEPDFRIEELARAGHDYIIVDTKGEADRFTVELEARADLCVLTANAAVDELRPTAELAHELLEAGVSVDRIAIVLTKIHNRSEAKFAREYLTDAVLTAVEHELPDEPAYVRASNVGQAPSEAPADKPREAAQALADELIKMIRKLGQKAREVVPQKRFVPTGKW